MPKVSRLWTARYFALSFCQVSPKNVRWSIGILPPLKVIVSYFICEESFLMAFSSSCDITKMDFLSKYQTTKRRNKCCVKSCSSTIDKDTNLNFHRVPKSGSDWFHFKSCNEVCMRLSEYFGIKVPYVILHSKWRNTCFTVWLEIFFSGVASC